MYSNVAQLQCTVWIIFLEPFASNLRISWGRPQVQNLHPEVDLRCRICILRSTSGCKLASWGRPRDAEPTSWGRPQMGWSSQMGQTTWACTVNIKSKFCWGTSSWPSFPCRTTSYSSSSLIRWPACCKAYSQSGDFSDIHVNTMQLHAVLHVISSVWG